MKEKPVSSRLELNQIINEGYQDQRAALITSLASVAISQRDQVSTLLSDAALGDELESEWMLSKYYPSGSSSDTLMKKKVASSVIESLSSQGIQLQDQGSDLVIQALSFLGIEFYSVELTAREISKAEGRARFTLTLLEHQQTVPDEEVLLATRRLARVMGAAARLGHLIRRVELINLSSLLLTGIRTICRSNLMAKGRAKKTRASNEELKLIIEGLWCLGKYRVRLLEDHSSLGVEGAESSLLFLDQAFTKKNDLQLYHAAMLAEALVDLDIPPNSKWLDSWLISLLPLFPEPSSSSLSDSLEFSMSTGHVAVLLTSISKLRYDPGQQWIMRAATALYRALLQSPSYSSSPAPLDLRSAIAIVSALGALSLITGSNSADPGNRDGPIRGRLSKQTRNNRPLFVGGKLRLKAPSFQTPPSWVIRKSPQGRDLSTQIDEYGPTNSSLTNTRRATERSISLLCGSALRSIVLSPTHGDEGRPSPLISGGCSLPSRLLSALARLLPPSHRGPWLRSHINDMESLVILASLHLKEASPADLVALTSSLASLGFYPGDQFLRWHDGACTRLIVATPPGGKERAGLSDAQLVEVREAYIALGHKPERRLYERMEAAKARERRVDRRV